MRRKYEVDESYWLVRRARSFARRALFTLRRAALTLKWGRIPKTWELSFVDRMRELERDGLTFNEVLSSTLPKLMGEDTSYVLRKWVGRRARCNPEGFARNIFEMFGASSRNVLTSLDKLVDKRSLLEAKAPKEPPIQSLLEAIQRTDAAMMVAQADKP
jgi:hypothetical protein